MKTPLILLCGLVTLVRAQDTDTQRVTLPAFVVSSATAELKPAPIANDQAGFLDTPRAYASLGQDILDLHNLAKIGALQSFDASTQTPGSYGHTATINIRGDMAELYQNGQRRTNNAAGFQPSLNGVEQVDIIKGAAPVVFGPGFYSGGYLNLQTKRAGSEQTTYGFTLGAISADHSYLNTTAFIDQTVSLSPTTAVRASYQGTVDHTFYHGARDDSQDIYLTLHHDLREGTLDLFLQHVWAADPQIEGINRVSQNLIDTRLYPSDHGLVPLVATDNLFSPGDFSNVNVTTTQAIYARPGFRSYTLAEYVDRRRFNAFAYLEWAKQFTFDQRLEWHEDTDFAYTIWGAQARYEYRQSFVNYFNAFFDAYDITQAGIRDATTLPAYYPGTPGPAGYLFFGPRDGLSDTTQSNLAQLAPFFQQRVRVGAWQLLYGGRADGYRVTVADPLNHAASDSLTTYSTSYTASLIHTMKDWSVYATFGHFNSVNGTVSGGGIVLAPDMRINPANLRSPNTLYEAGLRHDGKTRFDLTGFWQYRQQPDLYSYNPNDIVVRGVEANVAREWGEWGVRASATYNEGSFVDSLPYEVAPTVTMPGDYRIPGFSRLYTNATLTYSTHHWVCALTGRYQSKQSGNILGTYHIPGQYILDGAVAWHWRHGEIALNVGNLTNRWGWVHNGDEYADNSVIHHEALRNASVTVRMYR